jgi:hypothetical protein
MPKIWVLGEPYQWRETMNMKTKEPRAVSFAVQHESHTYYEDDIFTLLSTIS